tara:strand:+ start:1320 stop:1913 length:594 start_codon:yes stop_codon:yes gene_type:complete
MKETLKEEILNFKRLIGEATDTSSSGSYEQPMGFDKPRATTICPTTGKQLTGTEINPSAPSVDVVDVTKAVIPMNQSTSYEGNMNTTQPGFDDLPFLSSHPSDWSFEGDEEEFLARNNFERPENPEINSYSQDNFYDGDDEEQVMSMNFDEMDDGYEDEDEEMMGMNFDEMDDDDKDDDVFQTLSMFTETKNGLGWR